MSRTSRCPLGTFLPVRQRSTVFWVTPTAAAIFTSLAPVLSVSLVSASAMVKDDYPLLPVYFLLPDADLLPAANAAGGGVVDVAGFSSEMLLSIFHLR